MFTRKEAEAFDRWLLNLAEENKPADPENGVKVTDFKGDLIFDEDYVFEVFFQHQEFDQEKKKTYVKKISKVSNQDNLAAALDYWKAANVKEIKLLGTGKQYFKERGGKNG
ncbi:MULTISPECIES: hypothetical protein [unclassified Enterococcus]|jgi:hypothetical protein|uniref:hypothetical protein n=1 Tax=unclassified Enterococcus TaxID=2608891 RepID=UPI003D27A7FD